MFSNKIISKEYSRSFAIIRNKTTGKVDETLYITPDLRELKNTDTGFEKVMKKYAINNNGAFELKDEYLFEPVVNLNNKRSHREVYVIYGATGSGKSYLVSKLFEKFIQAFPKTKDSKGRNLVYVSPNNVSNDEAFDRKIDVEPGQRRALKDDIKEVDIFKLDSPIDVYNEVFNNAMVVFDDCDSNSFSYDLEDLDQQLTQENLKQMSLQEKTKVGRLANQKVKLAVDYVNQSLKKFTWESRKNKTSLMYIFHDFFQSRVENMLLGEATKIIVFPYKLNRARFEKFMKEKLGFDKEQIKFILDRKYYMYDFLVLDKQDRLFYLSPDTLKLL